MSLGIRELSVLFALIVIFSGCGKKGHNEYVIYADSEYSFSIEYPKTWRVKHAQYPYMAMFISPLEGQDDDFAEIVGVTIISGISDSFSIDEYFLEGAVMGIKIREGDVEIIESRLTKLDDANAARIVCSYTSDSRSVKELSIDLIQDQTHYTLTCIALQETFERYRDVFERMCASFRIKDGND